MLLVGLSQLGLINLFLETLVGGAKVALWTIKYAITEGYKNIILEGDALNIIDPLRNSDCPPNWSITPY